MKFILSTMVALFMLLSYNSSISQTAFTAEAGYSEALKLAEGDLTNPQLLAVGTMKAKIDQPIPFEIGLGLNDGKSKAWVYVFEDENTQERKTYAMINIFIWSDVSSMLADALDSFMEFVPDVAITGSWEDSKQAVDWLTVHSDYIAIQAKYPTANAGEVGLGINVENPMVKMNEPYWSISFREGELADGEPRFSAFIHAQTGEVTISEYTSSVNESLSEIEGYVPSYPQPANKFVNVIIPETLYDNSADLTIYDVNGLELSNISLNKVYNNGWAKIDVSNLQTGVYFLKYNAKKGTFTERIIINR